MSNTTEAIKKGSIVKYIGNPEERLRGFYKVSFATKGKVNLKSVWGNKIYYKGISKSEVVEAQEEHWENFSKSETYRSM
tara:strand:+ start:468 stop:704 length:237 start_codon:yes stop_codon:yes gene_type:complete